ncbi:MAG: CNNM domain-containing protein, partial [Thiovulaceae bacterium]|nr:CNNM domain-containing protein [Sulfurimonadaceae bacterium]
TAFLFSTFIITFFGEIIPQAYFSRHALKMASLLLPLFNVYRILLWPLAKPSAWALDRWLGKEGVTFFREDELQEMIKLHIQDSSTEITRLEGIGALNFFELDDIAVAKEGVELDPKSIISLEFDGTKAKFPIISSGCDDPFLQMIYASRKPWIIITDPKGTPRLVLDADEFILEALLDSKNLNPHKHCHRPIMVTNKDSKLESVLPSFQSITNQDDDDEIVNDDVILVWGEEKRIITGADILGRLLKGVTKGAYDRS